MTAPRRLVPLHALGDLAVGSPLLVVALVLAGLGASVVVGLALAVLVRRRSHTYLLVTLAIATLLARTVVAALALNGTIDPGVHHLTEHGLDVAMVALVIAAVYTARQLERGEGGVRE